MRTVTNLQQTKEEKKVRQREREKRRKGKIKAERK